MHWITIVVRHAHDQFDDDDDQMLNAKIKEDVINILFPRVKTGLGNKVLALFNMISNVYKKPYSGVCIGGPPGDTGLHSQRFIVDTYGGEALHGGVLSLVRSFKVDRSAAYAQQDIAKI